MIKLVGLNPFAWLIKVKIECELLKLIHQIDEIFLNITMTGTFCFHL